MKNKQIFSKEIAFSGFSNIGPIERLTNRILNDIKDTEKDIQNDLDSFKEILLKKVKQEYDFNEEDLDKLIIAVENNVYKQ